MPLRLLIVAGLLLLFVGARPLYVARRRRLVADRPDHPLVPARLHEGRPRTWLVFTTPYCATCDPVIAGIADADPGAHIVKVDATEDAALARAFSVRTAPTVLLADEHGEVQERLVGPAAVQSYLRTSYLPDCQSVVDQS